MPESTDARDAAYGEKMIEIKVRFWTNNLATGRGKVRPKHGWTSGVVRIERNDSHDIVPKSPVPFNSMGEIAAKIEKVLIDHDITLHRSDRVAKYLV
jgi:hypothetical protein